MNNTKVRIYELSKELQLDNNDIIAICKKLNIQVKSHSSTITTSQAEQVKKELASGANLSATAPQSKDKSKNGSGKQKQHIVSLKHNKNQNRTEKSQAAGQKASVSTQTLASPPQRNLKENNSQQLKASQTKTNSNTANTTELSAPQPPKTSETLLAAPKPPVSQPKADLIAPPRREKMSQNKTNQGNQTKLSEPSSRLTAPNKPKLTKKAQKPINKKTEKAKILSLDKQSKVKEPKEIKPPKLQGPPQRPTKSVVKEITPNVNELEEENIDSLETEATDLNTLLEPPKRPKLKDKKRTAETSVKSKGKKGKDWDEEDEDVVVLAGKSKNKAGKVAGTKLKKRPKPLIDDDEDVFEDELEELTASNNTVSLSMARPPKPKSMLAKQTTTATNKTNRPKKSLGRNDSSRSARADKKERQVQAGPVEMVTLTDNLTVRELSDKLNISPTEIITKLFLKGVAVNITQTLDLETATMVAEELGVSVDTPEQKAAAAKNTEMLDEADLEHLQSRPPVVTIMGHVDHGKTTLLDSIRKTKVAQGEAGGITQHIGAYHVDVEHNGKKQQIVFLDTPGHEAFTAMRARGTRVTDIAILVVAADDGVQPQTREAISHAKAAQVPIIVAINKMDKPDAEPDRIKQELTELGLVPEEWGGDTIMVPVSALKGDNLDQLLEMIVLVSELEELSANPDRPAKGTIIEAHLDRARGPVASLLVQNGTLRVGDCIVAGSVFGKIRAMVDDLGEKVEAAGPSFAVEVLGLNDVPSAGDEFDVFPNEKEARAVAETRSIEQRDSRLQSMSSSRRVTLSSLSAQAQEGELKELNIILKADVQGSVEAILGSLQQLPQDEVQIRVLLAAPGEITETDVDLAAASGAVIIGFNTTLASGAQSAADNEGVDIRQYNIIYKLLDDIQGAMEGLLDPEEVEEGLGEAQVRAVFPVGKGSVAGCYVQSGKLVRNAMVRIMRGNKLLYEGNLDSLKRMKEDVREVNSGYECGVGLAKFNNWQEGDIIQCYQMVYKRRTLAGKDN